MENASQSAKKQARTARVIAGYWVPVVLWMALIFFLSGRHSVRVSPEYALNFLFFKLLHILEYAVLYVLSVRAMYASAPSAGNRRLHRRAFILTVMYAMTDEIHQVFVPSREGTLRDVIIDAAGAGSVWYYLSTRLPKAPEILRRWAKRWDVPY